MTKNIIFASIAIFMALAPLAHAETYSTSESAKPQQYNEELMRKQRAVKIPPKEKLMSLSLEKREEMRREFNAKREEFKTKLQGLRDQRKKLIIERVDKRLATINQNWVQRMNASITRMENLLQKFSDRSERLKAEGKDTSEVDSAITEAETAIQAAKDAIETQQAREYVADLTDEENLKLTVGESMSGLRKDLKTAHDVIKAAKQKVIDVARALAKINSSSDLPSTEPTQPEAPSATTAPGI